MSSTTTIWVVFSDSGKFASFELGPHVGSIIDDRGQADDCSGRLRHYREAKRSNRSLPLRPVEGALSSPQHPPVNFNVREHKSNLRILNRALGLA
jgi:hypothetical protein